MLINNMRKEILKTIIKENPEAVLVKNKYKVLYGMLRRIYPNFIESIPKDKFIQIIFDAINGNRDWQMLTEGFDKEIKTILSQRKQIDMGYLPGYNEDIKKLKTL